MDVPSTTPGAVISDTVTLECFEAIVSFVDDLYDVFGNPKKVSPISLYHRMIQTIKKTDVEAMNKIVSGFRTFLHKHELDLLKNEIGRIPQNTIISAGGKTDRVCLEIQKYFHQSRKDAATSAVIRQHLLTIGTILNPSDEKLAELENAQKTQGALLPGLDTSTKEGQFINGLMEDAKAQMEGMTTSDPTTAMMKFYQSGIFGKMMNGMKDGNMDPRVLKKTMKATLNALIPDSDEEEDNDTPAATPKEKIEDPD